jgi:hypothetical protein
MSTIPAQATIPDSRRSPLSRNEYMDPISIISGVSAVAKICLWAGQEIYDLANTYNSANSVLSSISRECSITATSLMRTQDVLRERPEAFARKGRNLELLDSFDDAVGGIRQILKDLSRTLAGINSNSKFKKGAKFVQNESDLKNLLEDMRAQRSLIDSVMNSIQM